MAERYSASIEPLPVASVQYGGGCWKLRTMPKFAKHIFVCMNTRESGHPRGSCDPTGQGELQRLFKTKLAQRGIPNSDVRANKCGCLDQCELGPTVVVYPEAVWYGHVTSGDVDEIIESHIIGGRLVERLVISDAILNTTHKKS
jgi:(2Fe-2S) ferredoxin